MFRIKRIIIGGLLIIAMLTGGAYFVALYRISGSVDFDDVTVPTVLKVATGKEIKVRVKTTGSARIVVEVSNQSTEDVYLPYLPGRDSERAEYAIGRLEEWDESQGKFVSSGDGHFAPGLNPLAPGTAYTYEAYLERAKIYRITMPILVDKNLRDRIKLLHTLSKDRYDVERNAIDEELDLARSVFTTQEFKF